MHDEKSAHSTDLPPVRRRRLQSSIDIHDTPADRIAYQHTVLCQTCLPYRDPGADARVWHRQQGIASLRLEAGAARDPKTRKYVELGLPYGSRPRLILSYLNSEALRCGSPQVEVENSLTAFIRRIQDRPPTGPEVRRFKEQLARLAAATVRMALDVSDQRAFQINTQIIDVMELWLEKDEQQRILWPAVVELSPRYFDSLTRHAVPLDERAIAALSNSPLALDVYAWLAQRLHRIPKGKPQCITWTALYEQFGHGFTRLRDFRRDFHHVVEAVWTQYQTARIEAGSEGLTLRHSSPPVAARLVPVRSLLG